jgi:hypothetical protein
MVSIGEERESERQFSDPTLNIPANRKPKEYLHIQNLRKGIKITKQNQNYANNTTTTTTTTTTKLSIPNKLG